MDNLAELLQIHARYLWFREHATQLTIETDYSGERVFIKNIIVNKKLKPAIPESVDAAIDAAIIREHDERVKE